MKLKDEIGVLSGSRLTVSNQIETGLKMSTRNVGNSDCMVINITTISCLEGDTCLIYTNGATPLLLESFPKPSFEDGFLYASFALMGIAIVFSITAIVFLVMNKDKPVLKLSQYHFLMLFSASFLVLNCSIFLQLIQYLVAGAGLCEAYFILFFMSQIALISVLALKTWRAWRLLRGAKTLQRIKITNKFLYAFTVALEIPVVAICIGWFVTDGPNPNPCISLNCSGNGANPFELTLNAYVLVGVLILNIVACIARNVPSVAGESGAIAINSAFVLVGLIVVIIVVINPNLKETEKTFAFVMYLFFCTFIGLSLLIFQKSRWFHLNSDQLRKLFLDAAKFETSNTEFAKKITSKFVSQATMKERSTSKAESTEKTSESSVNDDTENSDSTSLPADHAIV